MKFHEYIYAIVFVPYAFRHIHRIRKELINSSYASILECKITKRQKTKKVAPLTKSYFWASKIYGKNICLARSIALYQCLIQNGYAVEHRIGVSTNSNNFAAHAWVEYQKQPLNETKDLKVKFSVLKKP